MLSRPEGSHIELFVQDLIKFRRLDNTAYLFLINLSGLAAVLDCMDADAFLVFMKKFFISSFF
jgi:hypothetical protein